MPARATPRSPLPPCVVGYAADYGRRWVPTWRDTRLGGVTVLRPPAATKEAPLCGVCGRKSVLLLQAFAPTARHAQRILVVHVCNSARCAGDAAAWTAQRVVFAEVAEAETKSEAQEGAEEDEHEQGLEEKSPATAHREVNTLPHMDSDSESDSSEDIAEMHELLKRCQVKIEERASGRSAAPRQLAPSRMSGPISSVSEPPTSVCAVAADAYDLPIVPVEVDYDVPSAQHGGDDADIERLLSRYRAEATAETPDGSVGAATFAVEADEPLTPEEEARDAFRDCLARAPGHVVRYQRGGAPVWPAHPTPAAKTTASCVCGAPRVFELQLMPACLHFLHVDKAVPPEQDEAGMNWASAAVFTCADDCETAAGSRCDDGGHSVVSEVVHVQPDEF